MSAVPLPHRSDDHLQVPLETLIRAGGSTSHGYVQSTTLFEGRNATRNLADIVHHFTMLHGRHPGVVDHAALHTVSPEAREWFGAACDGFGRERAYVTQLTSSIGPIPSTPGQAASQSTVLAQRHALNMLAQSDRTGCAFGAAIALVCDWKQIRMLLDQAAKRIGSEPPECLLPDIETSIRAADAFAETPALKRALHFGIEQLLTQHSGLWDILQARQIARADD